MRIRLAMADVMLMSMGAWDSVRHIRVRVAQLRTVARFEGGPRLLLQAHLNTRPLGIERPCPIRGRHSYLQHIRQAHSRLAGGSKPPPSIKLRRPESITFETGFRRIHAVDGVVRPCRHAACDWQRLLPHASSVGVEFRAPESGIVRATTCNTATGWWPRRI